MRKVLCRASYGYAGTDEETEFEFDDETSDEEIEEIIKDYVLEKVDWSWVEQ